MLSDIFDVVTDLVEDTTGVSKKTQSQVAGIAVTAATAGLAWGVGSEIAETFFDDEEEEGED